MIQERESKRERRKFFPSFWTISFKKKTLSSPETIFTFAFIIFVNVVRVVPLAICERKRRSKQQMKLNEKRKIKGFYKRIVLHNDETMEQKLTFQWELTQHKERNKTRIRRKTLAWTSFQSQLRAIRRKSEKQSAKNDRKINETTDKWERQHEIKGKTDTKSAGGNLSWVQCDRLRVVGHFEFHEFESD